MRRNFLALLIFGISIVSFGQNSDTDLKMSTDYTLNNDDLWRVLSFEGIQFQKAIFTGSNLKNKSFHLKVKEIWDGEIVSDSTIANSATLPFEQFKKINDTIFEIKVVSKLTSDNKLKMDFNFPRFSVPREFKAHKTVDSYSLRNLVSESKLEIDYNKPFVLFAYILPYHRDDNSASYCDVGSSGKDIENWGKKFGIKHYLIFELEFK